jgi:hypothetical protein
MHSRVALPAVGVVTVGAYRTVKAGQMSDERSIEVGKFKEPNPLRTS